ncbi:MAG: gluconate 2-dehydrogenase subunit 3 family protein [Gemmatimonadota bacterium]
MDMDRREAIRRVSVMLGGAAFVGGSGLLTACEQAPRPSSIPPQGIGDFSPDDIVLLDEVAETILPETGTPGAKAAAVGAFMALMVTDTYAPADQEVFRSGMTTLDETSRGEYGVPFLEAAPRDRLGLLQRFDRDQVTWSGPGEHWFRMMKQLALLGYFTSEIGCTVAQRYLETPGRFDPCVPHRPGERNWAGHA